MPLILYYNQIRVATFSCRDTLYRSALRRIEYTTVIILVTDYVTLCFKKYQMWYIVFLMQSDRHLIIQTVCAHTRNSNLGPRKRQNRLVPIYNLRVFTLLLKFYLLLLKGIGTSQTSKYVFGVFAYLSYRFHTHMNNRGA